MRHLSNQILSGTSSPLGNAELYLSMDGPDPRVTTYNNPPFIAGKKGNAMSFNGQNHAARLTGYDLLSDSVSFGCWLNFNSQQTQYVGILGKSMYASYVGRWGLAMSEQGRIAAIYQPLPGNVYVVEDNVHQSAYYGSWTHLAVIIDRISSTIKIYINGVLKNTTFVVIGDMLITNSYLFIGAYGNPTGSAPQIYFKGLIDEVFFIRKALTQNEIIQIYNS